MSSKPWSKLTLRAGRSSAGPAERPSSSKSSRAAAPALSSPARAQPPELRSQSPAQLRFSRLRFCMSIRPSGENRQTCTTRW